MVIWKWYSQQGRETKLMKDLPGVTVTGVNVGFIVVITTSYSDGKASAYNAGDLGSIPGSGRSPGEGNGNPLQYSCLEKSHGLRSLVGYSSWGHRVGHNWATTFSHLKGKASFGWPCSLTRKVPLLLVSCPLPFYRIETEAHFVQSISFPSGMFHHTFPLPGHKIMFQGSQLRTQKGRETIISSPLKCVILSYSLTKSICRVEIGEHKVQPIYNLNVIDLQVI